MQRGADAGGAESQRPGLLLGERDQVADRIHRQRRIHQERCRNGAVAGDRNEVLLRIVGQLALGIEIRLGRVEAGLRSEQRVAVVLGPHHVLRRDRVSGAAFVFDDHAVLPQLRQPLCNGAGEHVGQARRPTRSPRWSRCGPGRSVPGRRGSRADRRAETSGRARRSSLPPICEFLSFRCTSEQPSTAGDDRRQRQCASPGEIGSGQFASVLAGRRDVRGRPISPLSRADRRAFSTMKSNKARMRGVRRISRWDQQIKIGGHGRHRTEDEHHVARRRQRSSAALRLRLLNEQTPANHKPPRTTMARAAIRPGAAAVRNSCRLSQFMPMRMPPMTGPTIEPMRPMPRPHPRPEARIDVG